MFMTAEKLNTRTMQAAAEYPTARALAKEHRMELIHHGACYYSLKSAFWEYSIWPATQKINSFSGPYLALRANWGLVDVVRAAIEVGE